MVVKTKSKIDIKTKIALISISLSGIALAAIIFSNKNSVIEPATNNSGSLLETILACPPYPKNDITFPDDINLKDNTGKYTRAQIESKLKKSVGTFHQEVVNKIASKFDIDFIIDTPQKIESKFPECKGKDVCVVKYSFWQVANPFSNKIGYISVRVNSERFGQFDPLYDFIVEWLPTKFHEYPKLTGKALRDSAPPGMVDEWKNIYEKDLANCAKNNCTIPSSGFLSDFGKERVEADIISYIKYIYILGNDGENAFLPFFNGDSGSYQKKLNILKKYKHISSEQYKAIVECYCQDSDSSGYKSDNCGKVYLLGTKGYLKSGIVKLGTGSLLDKCDGDTLKEQYCKNGLPAIDSYECPTGCNYQTGACNTCLDNGSNIVTMEKGQLSQETGEYVWTSKQLEKAACSADGKNLDAYLCVNGTLSKTSQKCEWKCDPASKACLGCNAKPGSCAKEECGVFQDQRSYSSCSNLDDDSCLETKTEVCCPAGTPLTQCTRAAYKNPDTGKCACATIGWNGPCTQAQSCGSQCLGANVYRNCMTGKPGSSSQYNWYFGVCPTKCTPQANSSCWAFCE